MKPFTGKLALVTGSSRGIGRAIALKLADNGADIVVNYVRKKSDAEDVAAQIKVKGCRAIAVRANMSEAEDIQKLVETAKNEFGKIDFLVNNAVSAVLRPVAELTDRHVEYTLNINVKAFVALVQSALPCFTEQGGSIVSITSLGSQRYLKGYGILGASKAAVESLTRTLAVELAPKGIRVNVVCGGPVDTDALRMLPDYEKLIAHTIKFSPGGRMGQPDDIAGVVSFLCSDDARWIYGQTLIVDGGLSLY